MPQAMTPTDPHVPPRPEYQAAPGKEDRHGEMTGAISINMALCMPLVAAWAIFIGPQLFESLGPTLIIAVILAVVMPLACMPLSRRIWARLSHFMDRSDW